MLLFPCCQSVTHIITSCMVYLSTHRPTQGTHSKGAPRSRAPTLLCMTQSQLEPCRAACSHGEKPLGVILNRPPHTSTAAIHACACGSAYNHTSHILCSYTTGLHTCGTLTPVHASVLRTNKRSVSASQMYSRSRICCGCLRRCSDIVRLLSQHAGTAHAHCGNAGV